MGEVERIPFFHVGLYLRPRQHLSGIGDQKLNDGPSFRRLIKGEKGLAGLPSILQRFVPTPLVSIPLSHDDTDPIVPHVESLGRALYAVPQDRNHLPT